MLVKEERKAKKANKSGRNARKKERQAEVGDYSWQLTPTPSSTPLSSSTTSSSSLPSPADQNVADDAGGDGSAPSNQENQFRKAVKTVI